MAAYGLYTHIASNKTRSMLLLGGLFLLIYVLVFAGALIAEVMINGNGSVAYYMHAALADLVKALPWATLGAAAWIVIAYFFHQKMIDAVTGGTAVTRLEQPRLYNLLENLCISRGITMPQLKIMDSPALNAFATGLNPRQYAVTVTTGLLEALDDQEIEAVLGHELTHIRNGDVRMLVIAVVIAGVLTIGLMTDALRAVLEAREPGVLDSIGASAATTRDELIAELTRQPIFESARRYREAELAAYDPPLLRDFLASRRVLRRADAPWGLAAADPAVERMVALMKARHATHVVVLSPQPVDLIVLAVSVISADPATETALALVRRLLLQAPE